MGNSNLKATDLDPDNFQGKSKSKLFVVIIGLARLHSILLQNTLYPLVWLVFRLAIWFDWLIYKSECWLEKLCAADL